jgi:large subunit ribosomal protein L30
MSEEKLRVTLYRSLIGEKEPRRRTARALGLRRPNQSVTCPDNPSIRGMLRVIADLVRVEPVGDA